MAHFGLSGVITYFVMWTIYDPIDTETESVAYLQEGVGKRTF
jgi:hypothetical protein